jgi:asparagine synthase (glutamine-hydrolysing)
MCGIAGVFGRSDPDTVRAMLATLAHRGPDDEHCVAGADFTLGARRLAIVDVAGGRQPVANEDGSIWAVQNGELYNFPHVRTALQHAGHRLQSRCDTEVLPHLYEDLGAGLVERIDGMFAVALWDDARKVGLLARDRMGKKPLYYLHVGGALYFASELKALLKVPDFERRLSLEALHHFLSYKHVPHPHSIFEGIAMLPPAHRMTFRPGHEPDVARYWDLSFADDGEAERLEPAQMVDRLISLLGEGIRRRLLGDVPIGFFLSGGIDSGLSTALAAESVGGRIKTFTLTYPDDRTPTGKTQDRRWARWVADRYGTDHHEATLTPTDFVDSLRQVLRCFDEPFAGVTSTYFLAQVIARHVKVAISGDGADELFGSYLSHRLAQPLARPRGLVTTSDPGVIRPFAGDADILARLAGLPEWEWRHRLMVFTDDEKERLYARDVAEAARPFSTREHLRQHMAQLTASDPLNRILELEFRTMFPDQVLTFVDRLSMAHSLEVRSAYLDTAFVTFVARLPGSLKIKDGETKWLLKQAALRYFPPEMVFRPKEGFIMPVADWLRDDLGDYVRETLAESRLAKHGLFDSDYVQRLVETFYRGRHDYSYANKILALLVFQEWYEIFMM